MATLPEPLENLDIKILQGADWSIEVQVDRAGVPWTGLNLGTATASIKRKFGDEAVLVNMTVTADLVDTSKFILSLSKAQTTALNAPAGGSFTREVKLGVWDFKVVLNGVSYRLLQGAAVLSRGVTA